LRNNESIDLSARRPCSSNLLIDSNPLSPLIEEATLDLQILLVPLRAFGAARKEW